MAQSDFDAASQLTALRMATSELLAAARRLSESDVRQPSLLPGWSRAHVLAHLANNAEGSTRLLAGVEFGTPGWEYADLQTRADDIDTGAKSGRDELLDRLESTARLFDEQSQRIAPNRWSTTVVWTVGHRTEASWVVEARLLEVELHHIDLAAERTFDDWSDAFTSAVFTAVRSGFSDRADFPALSINLSDAPEQMNLGSVGARLRVSGTQRQVLAWLLGRSTGDDLGIGAGAALPMIPDLY